MPFDSPDIPLTDLLKTVGSGKLQLPDFQREWKWDDDRIASLLASISLDYPVGVVMTLLVGADTVRFAPKLLAGVEVAGGGEPEELLLDGQQRLTSLYQALQSGRPVETMDPRGKRLRRWYYLDINKALDSEADREEAILSVAEDRRVRDNFGRDILADYSSTEAECASEVFPLAKVFDVTATQQWMLTYLRLDTERMDARLAKWTLLLEGVLSNFTRYTVPVIRLHRHTPKEAVCTVFEKVNTGGVPLNVFELLTAMFAAASGDFRLKDDWERRHAEVAQRPVLRSITSSDFLQIVALLTTYSRRQTYLASGGDPNQAPGVSCKRKDILRLELSDYRKWADQATEALKWAARFLNQEHIFRSDDIPYRTQLVPLAAIRAILGMNTDKYGPADKLRRWFWCGVLGELYGGAIETRFARDLEQVVPWMEGDAPEPGTVADATFRAARILTLRTRNSAAYKGVYALLMRDDCLDWVYKQPLNMATFFEYQVDIHHVFPKHWCETHHIDAAHRESIVNKTPLSYATNRSIGGRSPKEYMLGLASKAGISDNEIDGKVLTHRINPKHLRSADFTAFFDERSRELLSLIGAAMGKEAIPSEATADDDVGAFGDEADDEYTAPEDPAA